MQKKTAKKLLHLMFELGAALDGSAALVKRNESDAVFKRYRATIGKLMGDMLIEVINPICSEHPEMKPTQLFSPGEAPRRARPYRHKGIPAPRRVRESRER